MIENENQNKKSLAEDILLRSRDEVSDDKEKILEKVKDKIVIIKETNKIEVISDDKRPLVLIPLYLIGKFLGFKILKLFDEPSADTLELSKNLNLPPKAFSRPLGILTRNLVEKTDKGYKIKAFKILEFLDSLEKDPSKKIFVKKKTRKTLSKEKRVEINLNFNQEGLKNLCDFLDITEEELRKIVFFRENDLRIIDTGFLDSKKIKEKQLDSSLLHLLVYKYCFNVEKCPSGLLRDKLKLLGIKSLVNLSSHLHKFSEYIIHEAGKKGSTNNYYLITLPGENRIKDKIKVYLESKKKDDKTQASNKEIME